MRQRRPVRSARVRRIVTRIEDADQRWFVGQAEASSPLADAVLPRLTRAADRSLLWIGVAAALTATRDRRGRRAAGRGLASIGLASLVANQVLKRALPRDRPLIHPVPHRRRAKRVPTSTSFPSGHSASAVAFAVGVGMEIPELAVPLGLSAAAVCWSRVYTGVHYPSDVLFGAALGAGSAAVLSRVVPLSKVRPRDVTAPPSVRLPQRASGQGVVVVVNHRAGMKGRLKHLAAITGALPDAEVVEVDGDLIEVLRSAAARAEVLAISGGDGSVNAAAAIALEHGLPLAVLPGGTLNHFAADLGVHSVLDTLTAIQDGSAVQVNLARISIPGGGIVGGDIADGGIADGGIVDGGIADGDIAGGGIVGGGIADGEVVDGDQSGSGGGVTKVFLNTASVGAYPQFVRIRRRWEGKLGKPIAAAIAARAVLRSYRPERMVINGVERRVGLLFVGNGGYEPRGFAPDWRPSLVVGELDLRLLDLQRRFGVTRLVVDFLLGRVARSSQYVEQRTRELLIQRCEPGLLAQDGEIGWAGAELRFSVDPRPLTVYRLPGVRL